MRTFGHDAPRLSWLNGKTYPQQGDSRKNRSGHAPEETDARIENGIGVLARQELKDRVDAMRPKKFAEKNPSASDSKPANKGRTVSSGLLRYIDMFKPKE
jgi:hypothetical protein